MMWDVDLNWREFYFLFSEAYIGQTPDQLAWAPIVEDYFCGAAAVRSRPRTGSRS
jgi:hypothetical protein